MPVEQKNVHAGGRFLPVFFVIISTFLLSAHTKGSRMCRGILGDDNIAKKDSLRDFGSAFRKVRGRIILTVWRFERPFQRDLFRFRSFSTF